MQRNLKPEDSIIIENTEDTEEMTIDDLYPDSDDENTRDQSEANNTEENNGKKGTIIYYTSVVPNRQIFEIAAARPYLKSIKKVITLLKNHALTENGIAFKQVIKAYEQKHKSKDGKDNSHPAIFVVRITRGVRLFVCFIPDGNGHAQLLPLKLFLRHDDYTNAIKQWKKNHKLVASQINLQQRNIESHAINLKNKQEKLQKLETECKVSAKINFIPESLYESFEISPGKKITASDEQKEVLVKSNEEIKRIINNASKHNHILIQGPGGSGKTTACMLLNVHLYHFVTYMHSLGHEFQITYLVPFKLLKFRKQAEWNIFAASQKIPQDCVLFRTVNEQKDLQYGNVFIKKQECLNWFSNLIEVQNKNKLHNTSVNLDTSDETMKMVFAELCIIAIYGTNKKAYMSEKSVFEDEQTKDWLWKAYHAFKKLDRKVRAFTPLKPEKNVCYIADEIHAMKPVDIKSLSEQPICHFAGDRYQITKFGFDNINLLKTCIKEKTGELPPIVNFPFSYRVPLAVMALVNNVQKVMGDTNEIKSTTEHDNTGKVIWLDDQKRKELMIYLASQPQSTRIAVLTSERRNSKEVKEDYNTLSSTPAAKSGGLEYEVVIVDDLFDIDLLREFNKELRKKHNQKESQHQDETIKIKKQSILTDKRMLFCQLFMLAITRTKGTLVIWVPDAVQKQVPFAIEFLKKDVPCVLNYMFDEIMGDLQKSTREEWLALIKQLIFTGEKYQLAEAKDIYNRKIYSDENGNPIKNEKTFDEFKLAFEKEYLSGREEVSLLSEIEAPKQTQNDQVKQTEVKQETNKKQRQNNQNNEVKSPQVKQPTTKKPIQNNQEKEKKPDIKHEANETVQTNQPKQSLSQDQVTKLSFQSSQLFSAIQKGNKKVVEKFIKEGLDINIEIPIGGETRGGHSLQFNSCLLHVAVQAQQPHIVKYLLSIPNCNVNKLDGRGYTPLHIAVIKGNQTIVQHLLDCTDLEINKKNILIKNVEEVSYPPLVWSLAHNHGDISLILCNDQRIRISDEDLEYAINSNCNHKIKNLIFKKYIFYNVLILINNFNEDYLGKLFEKRFFMNILFQTIHNFSQLIGSENMFSYITSDRARLNLFIQFLMKKPKDNRRNIVNLLTASEKRAALLFVDEQSLNLIKQAIDTKILTELNVDQLLVVQEDLEILFLISNGRDITCSGASRRISAQALMKKIDSGLIEKLNKMITLGLSCLTSRGLRMLPDLLLNSNEIMFNFINIAIDEGHQKILELLLVHPHTYLTGVQLNALLTKVIKIDQSEMLIALLKNIKAEQKSQIDFDLLMNMAKELKAEKIEHTLKELTEKEKKEYKIIQDAMLKENPNVHLLEQCIKKGININININGLTPLHLAITKQKLTADEHLALIKVLLESEDIELSVLTSSPDINPPVDALALAAKTKNLDILLVLLNDPRIDIEFIENNIKNGHFYLLDLLGINQNEFKDQAKFHQVVAQINENILSRFNTTTLWMILNSAVVKNNLNAVKFILALDVIKQAIFNSEISTANLYRSAVEFNHVEIAKELKQYSQTINNLFATTNNSFAPTIINQINNQNSQTIELKPSAENEKTSSKKFNY